MQKIFILITILKYEQLLGAQYLLYILYCTKSTTVCLKIVQVINESKYIEIHDNHIDVLH